MARIKISKGLKSLIESVNKKDSNEDVAIRFISELYQSIKMDEMKNVRIPSKTFKPSSMKCPRNMQYQLMEVPMDKSDVSVELIGILESGSDRHLRIQKDIARMKENGFDCEYVNVGDFVRQRQSNGELLDLEIIKEPTEEDMETKLYNKKYNISFMCDGLLLYKGYYYILEIKTESTYKNSKRTDMAEEHIPQICAYKLSFNIDKVIMLYEDRDNCTKKAYLKIVTDQMVWDNVLCKIEEANTCLAAGTIARPIVSNTCRYCPYKARCKMDGGLSNG